MGSMRFRRLVPVEGSVFNNFGFDSSPSYSLSRALGTDPRRFELRQTKEVNGVVYYEVWSASYPTDGYPNPELRLRGHLTWETPEVREARAGHG